MATAPGENQMRIFKVYHDEMMGRFHEGTPEGLVKCEEFAKLLLGYAELPLEMRCSTCIMLSELDQPGYLDWAKEAVRVADLAWDQNTEHSEAEMVLRDKAHKCLKEAQEYFDKHGGNTEDEEDEEGVKDDDEDSLVDDEAKNAGEVISSGTSYTGADGRMHTVVHKGLEEAPQDKSLRVNVSMKMVEQWHAETQEWVTFLPEEVEWI